MVSSSLCLVTPSLSSSYVWSEICLNMDIPILISSDEESTTSSAAAPKPRNDFMDLSSDDERGEPFSLDVKLKEFMSGTSKRFTHDLSDSDGSEPSEFSDFTSVSDTLTKTEPQSQKDKRTRKRKCENNEMMKKVNVKEKQKKEDEAKKKAEKKEEQIRKKEEQARKKEEEALKKAEKKAAAEVLKKMKPGECMKFVTAVVDSNLLTFPFGGALLASIQSSGADSKIDSQLVPCSITWIQENVDGRKEEQNHVVIVWNAETLVKAIAVGTLSTEVVQMQELHPNKKVTLVVFGMENYFSLQKSNKTKKMRVQTTGSKNKESGSKSSSDDSAPSITRNLLEEALTEIQVLSDCCHRLLETVEDVGLFVAQFTKAIAETPYKKIMFDKTQKNLDWFATGDSKDCVRIDKNGNGFPRLWQKQMCQFNMVGLDLADAVINHYKTPLALITAFEDCKSVKEAECLLQDLPVRRGVGPLASSRRVGPDLGKKLYLFFTSDDENQTFSQDGK